MDSDSSLDEPPHDLGSQSPEDDSPSSPGELNSGSDSNESAAGDVNTSPLVRPQVGEISSPDRDHSSGRNASPLNLHSPHRNESPFVDRSPIRNQSPFENRSPFGNRSPPRNKSPFGNRSPTRNKSPAGNSSFESNSPVKSPTEIKSPGVKGSPPADRSAIASPLPDDKGSFSPNHSDNDGELSDSSNDGSRSSSSSSSSGRSNNRPNSRGHSRNDGDILNLESRENLKSPSMPPDSLTVPKSQEAITGHGEDLSDVSDLDSNDDQDSLDGLSDKEPKKEKVENKLPVPIKNKEPLMVEEVEQLDFEAEEAQDKDDKDEKEEGECVEEKVKENKSDDEGELKGEDLEEGEVTDDEENRPEETEPRPICRFYNRGQCTWGASCRFLHPGVTDKGNYTMFDMVRPLVPMNGPSMYSQPMDFRAPYEKPPHGYPPGRKEEAPVFESAWERGLRQAKEMMRKSNKRKETDMDFEEKKMNLSIGQEELDKENDYYTRPASPIMNEDSWGMSPLEGEGKYHREAVIPPRYDEFAEPPYYPHARGAREAAPWGGDYNRRVHYETEARAMRVDPGYGGRGNKYHAGGPVGHPHRQPIPDFYDKYEEPLPKKKKHPVREVTVQRVVEKPWRDDRYVEEAPPSSHRNRGDEWADPWMRSKSPGRTKGSGRPSRRQSYSSGSSYSSSSSSRSGSSASSYSSYSHNSRSRSRSKSRTRSGSHSPPIPRNARRKPTERNRTPPGLLQRKPGKMPDVRLQMKGKPSANQLLSEKKAVSERLLCMNPPAPSPRKQKDFRDLRPPSPGMMRKSAQNPPPPLAGPRTASVGRMGGMDRSKAVLASALVAKAAKLQHRLRSSRSTSGSESSGSSSESSESSYSTSSTSRDASPKAARPPKRIMIDERLALAQKVKAMDALKLSGQKPQIKLTLKTPNSNPVAGNKRSTTGLPELPELNLVRRDRLSAPAVTGKKRPAEGDLEDLPTAAKVAALSKPLAKQKATSRREELLKQLKAVEDAIARKRSKV